MTELERLIQRVPEIGKLIITPFHSGGGFDIAMCESTGKSALEIFADAKVPAKLLASMGENFSFQQAVAQAHATLDREEGKAQVKRFTDENGKVWECRLIEEED